MTDVGTLRRLNKLEDEVARLRQREPSYHSPVSDLLHLPAARGVWPMSDYDENILVYDLSGQARHLTPAGGPSAGLHNSTVVYFDLNGTTQYLSRASEAGLNLTGQMTFGGWFWADTSAGVMTLMIKGTTATPAYRLTIRGDSADQAQAVVTGATIATATGGAVTDGAWHFIWARFIPSTSISVGLDNVITTSTATIPATANSVAGAFAIGASGTPDRYLDGRASLCFLSALALSDTLLGLLYERQRVLFGV